MTNSICLDKNFSTTKLLTNEKPVIVSGDDNKIEGCLFLPTQKDCQGEGGLRIRGYFKKSYPDKPLITVVTVVYNGEAHLEQTIKSVIEQSYDNVEYIIVDGGSIDGTLDIVSKYEDQIDYWVSEKDSGIYDAMNKGIALATGEWINFMNVGDSFYENDTINYISCENNHKNAIVIYGNILNIYSSSHKVVYANKPLDTLYQGLPFSHQSSFTKKEYLKKYGFNLKYPICADYDLFYRLYMEKLHFAYVDIIVANYDMFGASTNYSKSFLEKKLISKKYEPRKNEYFKIRKYLVLKTKDYIKTLLSKDRVQSIKIWLSKNIYNKK